MYRLSLREASLPPAPTVEWSDGGTLGGSRQPAESIPGPVETSFPSPDIAVVITYVSVGSAYGGGLSASLAQIVDKTRSSRLETGSK